MNFPEILQAVYAVNLLREICYFRVAEDLMFITCNTWISPDFVTSPRVWNFFILNWITHSVRIVPICCKFSKSSSARIEKNTSVIWQKIAVDLIN